MKIRVETEFFIVRSLLIEKQVTPLKDSDINNHINEISWKFLNLKRDIELENPSRSTWNENLKFTHLMIF